MARSASSRGPQHRYVDKEKPAADTLRLLLSTWQRPLRRMPGETRRRGDTVESDMNRVESSCPQRGPNLVLLEQEIAWVLFHAIS